MSGNKRTWQVPYSVSRLVNMSRTWDFQSDVDDIPDCDDGEPRMARAARRVGEYLRGWRDTHGPNDDPWFDKSFDTFRVADVALLYSEYTRLARLEDRVQSALGPPYTTHVLRNGKLEEE